MSTFLSIINIILLSILLFFLNILFFSQILISNTLTISFANINFYLSNLSSNSINILFKCYLSFSFYSFFLFSIFFITHLIKSLNFEFKERSPPNLSQLNLLIGFNNSIPVYLSENDLYQNILITGAIGSGKTSSAMYPFTDQLISFKKNPISMLILDVKGNYNNFVKSSCLANTRENDYIELSFSSTFAYNPLDKPDLKEIVLAQRLKNILKLFSPETSESFWLDKAEEVICNAIKLCRLYNNNYVTFDEIHKLINNSDYLTSKFNILRNNFITNIYSKPDKYNLLSSILFFQNEFNTWDERTLSIIKSEINRITSIFVSDYAVNKMFCPKQSNTKTINIKEIISTNKILLFNININEYSTLSKIIAAYLKIDFQEEVLFQASSPLNIHTTAFICDEYHEYCTKSDSNFFSQSRESKCINIVCTQSYSSILNTLKDETCLNMILQNFINKIWFRSDDLYSIDKIQKLLGKEEKLKQSSTFSENSNNASYNFFTKKFLTNNSSFSKSTNEYFQSDFIFDYNYFTKELPKFKALCYLCNDGFTALPIRLNMQPYFMKGGISHDTTKSKT